MSSWRADLAEFCSKVEEKMAEGERVYGDKTYDMSLLSLLDEVEQEVVDITGWSVFIYQKIRRVRALLDRAETKELPPLQLG